jgi:hypothetical protein
LNLPFTIEQFLAVFAEYNQAVWPFQIVLNLLALVVIILCFKKIKRGDKINNGILAFFWLWIGIVYHIMYFSSINKAAYVFGIIFILQGLVFIYAGILRNHISFKYTTSIYSITGAIFILYALIIYPAVGHLLGHVYPQSPTFGLPCPTTIFTFGILLFSDRRIPKYVLIIPFLWSLIGFSAAVNLSVYEDFGLVVAGILGVTLIYLRETKLKGTG